MEKTCDHTRACRAKNGLHFSQRSLQTIPVNGIISLMLACIYSRWRWYFLPRLWWWWSRSFHSLDILNWNKWLKGGNGRLRRNTADYVYKSETSNREQRLVLRISSQYNLIVFKGMYMSSNKLWVAWCHFLTVFHSLIGKATTGHMTESFSHLCLALRHQPYHPSN